MFIESILGTIAFGFSLFIVIKGFLKVWTKRNWKFEIFGQTTSLSDKDINEKLVMR